jgi:hypothetical protein
MDTLAFDTAPPARRLIELLKSRGWTGWTKLERVDPAPGAAGTRKEAGILRDEGRVRATRRTRPADWPS